MSDGLRLRPHAAKEGGEKEVGPTPSAKVIGSVPKEDEGDTFGKTPSGKVFKIPKTHDILSSLLDPRTPKSHLDLITLALLGIQILAFASLPFSISRSLFIVYFALWRIAYNLGLGWLLSKQSEKRWIVRTIERHGWMDVKRRPKVAHWVRKQLIGKMGSDYVFEEVPLEYNAWLFFRHLADVVLLNDFVSYCLFAFSWTHLPPNRSAVFHILRWAAGVVLILFNLWVKVDAHRVVKDYAWYWGDCFYERLDELIFDGVFSLAPHPMYSVGYAGYYGLSLISGSMVVLFASLAAHACQFAFLVWFENPHIERVYGERKPLVMRTPINLPTPANLSVPSDAKLPARSRLSSAHASSYDMLSDAEDEPRSIEETDDEFTSSTRYYRSPSTDSNRELGPPPRGRRPVTLHDLNTRYFYKDVTIFKNFDPFRARDLAFALTLAYAVLAIVVVPNLSPTGALVAAFVNALGWRLFHSFGLGWILKAQSESKWLVRHFLKHYAFDGDEGECAVHEAFQNWKAVYNWSLCMTYLSFGCLTLRCYQTPEDWTVGSEMLRLTGGLLLIGIHVWTALSTYEVLKEFGWFYGDFFIEDYPKELLYTGIYRFLNNPERIMGGAAFFGLSLISASKLVTGLAVFSVISHLWFLRSVENPHMQKLYGDAIRKDAGVTKTLKSVAERRTPSELRKVVREVQGTFGKVTDEAGEALGDFFKNATRGWLSDCVKDSKVLLQQSGERLVITRVSNKVNQLHVNQYSLRVTVPTETTGDRLLPDLPSTLKSAIRVRYGEPISVQWKAPLDHSRRDWIGIYRVGVNPDEDVTRISSKGLWLGVYSDEWEGDDHVGSRSPSPAPGPSPRSKWREGTVVFSGSRLPSKAGIYEMRYHHDGHHNVMALTRPIHVYLEKPSDPDHFSSVYSTILRLVCSILSHDPALVPAASRLETGSSPPVEESASDFIIYESREAEMIAYAVSESCGVDLASEVVIADANVVKLSNRVLASRRVLRPWQAG